MPTDARVVLKDPFGHSLRLTVPDSFTLKQIKCVVQEREGIPMEHLHFNHTAEHSGVDCCLGSEVTVAYLLAVYDGSQPACQHKCDGCGKSIKHSEIGRVEYINDANGNDEHETPVDEESSNSSSNEIVAQITNQEEVMASTDDADENDTPVLELQVMYNLQGGKMEFNFYFIKCQDHEFFFNCICCGGRFGKGCLFSCFKIGCEAGRNCSRCRMFCCPCINCETTKCHIM